MWSSGSAWASPPPQAGAPTKRCRHLVVSRGGARSPPTFQAHLRYCLFPRGFSDPSPPQSAPWTRLQGTGHVARGDSSVGPVPLCRAAGCPGITGLPRFLPVSIVAVLYQTSWGPGSSKSFPKALCPGLELPKDYTLNGPGA